MMEDRQFTFTTSLINLPKITFSDVHRLTEQHSITARSKLDKGYSLFFEKYVYDYEVSNIIDREVAVRSRCYRSMKKREQPHYLKIVFQADGANLQETTCSCTAGKVLCNHLVALLFQSAHYSMLQVRAVPPPMACTSSLQTWHRPRTKGIHAEPVPDLVVRRPKPSPRSVCKSTLYQAYTGSLPDLQVLSLGETLKNIRPQPLISSVLHGLSEVSMVDSSFGPVPRGSPLSYQCPPVVKLRNDVQHPDAPSFPKLPLEGSTCPTTFPKFASNSQQFLHLDSLTVTHEMAAEREEQTREQSECPLWQALRKPRVTASRFYEVSHVKGPSSGQTLAGRILKGVRQTPAMKRGLDREPQVLEQYSKHCNVNVSRCGFVIHPDAPHLGASPDARVYDPSAVPCFGLAEVKCPDISNISEAGHVKIVNGQAKLKKNHKYHWQVQGQLAITGLSWCDFITDTEEDFTVERVWRDDEFIKEMKNKVDLYFFGTYMNVYFQQKVK
ncbi:uncharacterized protein LOC130378926 isoform X1 [Gadus chalcogrammus]|uniref:uncharacterized protein LOC130378926 isoform X1 n=1 Tax=Gadus chalcogrammus TaxID=1042646 RepID=UPI0024C23E80|nr:uncharacterized protein LOC130378926 isoform X1 [Gadus chalcogrammus]